MATDSQLASLYRYFAWADEMRTQFTKSLRSDEAIPGLGDPRTFVTMSYWYGALYVVVEAWKKYLQNLSDPGIDALLANKHYVKLLKRYRDATFHYRPKYFDEQFLELMREGSQANKWTQDLHQAFRSYLENWFESSGHLKKSRENERDIETIKAEIVRKSSKSVSKA